MSLQRKTTIQCPKCQETIEVGMWQSLNAHMDPEAAKRLMKGEFFVVKCPKCGFSGAFEYPLLYNDMEHHMMIQLAAAQSEAELQEMIKAYREGFKETMDQVEKMAGVNFKSDFRIVTSGADLQEKALIIHAGFDDRAIEVMKFLLLAQVAEQNKDANFAFVRYYEEADGKRLFLFFDEKYQVGATVPFDQALYDMMKNDFDFSEVKDDIIDMNWALQFVQKTIEAQGEE